METSFFNQIARMNIEGTLNILIAKGAGSNYVVSVLLQNEQCGDEAKNLIPSINLRGTPEELDAAFFQQVSQPLEETSALMVDMEAFKKGLELARKQSAMEKEKTDKERKEKDAKAKRYKDAMAKVDELDKAGKPRDAWMKVPSVTEFPEHEQAIRQRQNELSAKFAPDLFGDSQPAEQVNETPDKSDEGLFREQKPNELDGELNYSYHDGDDDDNENY